MVARRSPRKKPAQRRSQETVAALLTAAARILEQEGYAGASVNRIAAVAGVSVGSLYQYFPTKEALVAAVAEAHVAESLATFQAGLVEVIDLDFDDAIRAVALLTVRTMRVRAGLRRALATELPESLFDNAQFNRALAAVLEGYLTLHASRVRPADLGLAVTVLVAAVEAAARAASERGDPDDVVAGEVGHLIAGYLAR